LALTARFAATHYAFRKFREGLGDIAAVLFNKRHCRSSDLSQVSSAKPRVKATSTFFGFYDNVRLGGPTRNFIAHAGCFGFVRGIRFIQICPSRRGSPRDAHPVCVFSEFASTSRIDKKVGERESRDTNKSQRPSVGAIFLRRKKIV